MSSPKFIGRGAELDSLNALHNKNMASIAVIKGRRRVGKSRLIAEFALNCKQNKLWSFSGLAPSAGLDAQSQRDHFANQLALLLNEPPFTFNDWTDAFERLSMHVNAGDIVLFDEISWMGDKDPSFIPKLKAWWDKQSTPFILVFCGSISTWIEENILNNTAFFGRINLTITLKPLSIGESAKLLKAHGFQGSDYDTYKLLGILGGIPWYLEQMLPGHTADEMLTRLCFKKDGLLVLEFNRIFHDLFGNKGQTYKKILNVLKDGKKTLSEIRHAIEFPHSGTLSALMEHLITAGFASKQNLWSFKTTKASKQSLYYISDPYMRFYLKVIEPNLNKIDLGAFENVSLSHIRGFDAHMGLQLEQLLLQNRNLLTKALGVQKLDIVSDGPYRQTKTTTKRGCQIDYLVQTITQNLFVCEFKFKRTELGNEIIEQMRNKINALKVPRGFACIPVLLHLGGVTSSVAIDEYFYRIINIAEFLENN